MPPVGLLPIKLVQDRIEAARAESTDALFNAVLYLAEAFLKTYTAALLAGIPDESDRHRYRLCHKLVRAAGIGDWDEVLADASTGPASQHLLPGAALLQKELVDRVECDSWIYDASAHLHAALASILPELEPLPTRIDGRRWFSLLVQLRNKTRGHGAPTVDSVAKIVDELEKSLNCVLSNSVLMQLPCVYLKRNLSGKYHVAPLCGTSAKFDQLKGDRSSSFEDGVYVDLGEVCRVELIETTLDLTEFYYPNGHFRRRTSEWLSYISGAVKDVDISQYLAPATALPPSSTEGSRVLDTVGNCFGNFPPRPADYVSRDELEKELRAVLTDDRHPIITLLGRGGIGKTSLALETLHRIAHSSERFMGIVWLSARDIDLLPHGPKLVTPSALTAKDMASQFASLFQPAGWGIKGFNADQYMAESLRSCEIGPLLVVFDNFETVRQPFDVFNWLDAHVRPPNKILITTRHREFKGDYPVEVGGMSEAQCTELILKTADTLGISGLVTSEFRKDIYRESEGHPYVIKILVGEAADGKSVRRIERIVAGKEDLLDALFERTYKRLTPAARRVFLTLSNWRSLVSYCALEALLLHPRQTERIDIASVVEDLRRVSLLDEQTSPHDGSIFLGVPLVAAVFGKRKLSTSPEQADIERDNKFLLRFGPTQIADVKWGLEPRVQRFFASYSDDLAQGNIDLTVEMPLLELIARDYSPTWLKIADLWSESRDEYATERTLEALTRYLETTPSNTDARNTWARIAVIRRQQGDWNAFVNAQVQIAELPNADLISISAAVNTFNSVVSNLDSGSRRTFAQRLAKAMEPRISNGDSTDYSRFAWLLIRCDEEVKALDAAERGLALDPSNMHCQNIKIRLWRKRAELARQAGDWPSYIDALIRVAEVPATPFQDVSDIANTFNQSGRDFELDAEKRLLLALRLAGAMEARIGSGTAIDCSRLGWVLTSAGETTRARRAVDRGLRLEPTNEYCLKLQNRLLTNAAG